MVRPTGIEPVLRASEARILSVGRRSLSRSASTDLSSRTFYLNLAPQTRAKYEQSRRNCHQI